MIHNTEILQINKMHKYDEHSETNLLSMIERECSDEQPY